jgi:putative glycosyltransferase
MISIVTSVYKSERFIDDFYKTTIEAIKELKIESFEFIFVLDGITDNSKQILIELKKSDQNIHIIELSRNFGHHYAAFAGLKNATGDLIFLIDCDLETNPRELIRFYNALSQDEDTDVVYGYQLLRKGGWFERISGKYFWRIFNLLSDYSIPENMVTERLMKRRYLNELIKLEDRNIFLAGMMHWVGFNQVGLPIQKSQREGKSTYGLIKKLNLLVEAVTSFSDRPMWLIFYFGLIITVSGVLLTLFYILQRLLNPDGVLAGFTTLAVISITSTGMISLFLGLTGIYISRIFKQSRKRPNFIIKKIE